MLPISISISAATENQTIIIALARAELADVQLCIDAGIGETRPRSSGSSDRHISLEQAMEDLNMNGRKSVSAGMELIGSAWKER
jgi:hypothetical protein